MEYRVGSMGEAEAWLQSGGMVEEGKQWKSGGQDGYGAVTVSR
jgi:hypothetical protein